MEQLKNMIRNIPDFPSPGVMFRDITTVLKDPAGLSLAIDAMANLLDGIEFDLVLGPESRGFIFGVPLAYKLNKGFVPARKAGKLPAEVVSKSYELEYGKAEIEVHKDALIPGRKVIIADDLLATGGTARAVADLVVEHKMQVAAFVFLIELDALGGRAALAGYDNINSVLVY